ncbi:Pkinase-domain-containing protein [Fomitiporia mediterranea MF3/22]|uniref:Pkinase-domain-containing protein n=1 Tax=Fomitiporia mediterranea (strain MF3/22) TaxID=694068 RepID=UPI0004408A61|nr:Pkinase-domain-containing protein [Fomitiporia mediterranea MF3/22]EJD02304.1 Pkinase-domain-containing protein [Fomitiporia mediterranea MF3/22]
MTALAPSALSTSLAGPSQAGPSPQSQSSSPASPTANFSSAQQAGLGAVAAKTSHSHLRSTSRPGTPTAINGNGSNSINGNSSGPSLEPPPGVSYAEFLASWGDAHVARWLSALDPHGKCAAHASAFRTADVRGSVLLELDQSSLKEIGVTSIGDRIRILNAVKALRLRCSTRHTHAQHVAGVALGHGQGSSSVSSVASSSGGSSGTTTNTITHLSPKLTVTNTDPADAFPRQHQRNRSRPAPLQLTRSSQTQNDLPRLIRDAGPVPDSARSATSMRPLPQPSNQTQSQVNTPQGFSSHSHSSSGSGSGGNLGASGRQHLPPLPPPPLTKPPLPPSSSARGQPPRLQALQQSSGRRTPTQAEAPPPPHYAPPPVPGQSSQGQTQNQNQNPPTVQTPTQSQNPALLTPSSSTSGGGWKGEYGLPAGPRSGQGVNSRATSPLPGFGRRSPGGVNTHTKAPSYSATTASSNMSAGVKTAPRPNTSGGHPYATASSGTTTLQPPPQSGGNAALSAALSPIAESFMGQGGLPTPVPPTAGSSASSSSMTLSTNPNASAYHGRGPFRPSTPSSHTAQGSGTGAPSLDDLRRRLVRFRLAGDGHSAMVNVADCTDGVEMLERVLRKFGKLSGSGHVDVTTEADSDEGGLCIDGWSVYLDWVEGEGPAKPLRESELLSLCNAGPDHPVRERGLTLRRRKRSKTLQQIFGDVPSTGTSGSGSGSLSPRSPVPAIAAPQDDDQYLGNSSVAFPRTLTPSQEREREREIRNMKRASSISVLSGLGVRDPERILDTSDTSAPSVPIENKSGGKSPSASSFAGKIRTFLGARPPSELIATHLPAYFPSTQPKILRRAVRQSMRFSSGAGIGGRPESGISASGVLGQAGNRRASRMSTSTAGRSSLTLENRRSSMASLPPPPVPDKNRMSQDEVPRMSISAEDGHSTDLHESEGEKGKEDESGRPTTPHLLPPVDFPSESFADSFHDVTVGASTPGNGMGSGARSGPTPMISRTPSTASRVSHRFSYMSELRARRDLSDTASMLTVDEITAEVELNRRKSLAASIRSGESRSAETGSIAGSNTAVGHSEEMGEGGKQSPATEEESYDMVGEDEGEEESDIDDEDTLEEELEEDEEETLNVEDDQDAPVKSTRGKRGAKWIRGALIGAGSFGSVYLGMDAMNGLLMAVKQVDLPTGSGPNEQRKKSMLDALEREIDLLRELQHENIVQYLDSSSDEKHLYIFLEYVPGGSVTALLRNYGAFEETLCRHFVKQILQGLSYLHSRDIIHRDIKGANILVDNKGGIKISDFGISKKVEETFLSGGVRAHRPSLQGSVYWMAPEVVKQVAHTRKADIWSVGCLVVEMLTGNHPYPTLNQMQAIFKIGSSAKPTIPSDISPEAEDFLQKTFETKYEARPDADELLQHPWIVHGPSSSSSSGSVGSNAKQGSTKSKGAKSG